MVFKRPKFFLDLSGGEDKQPPSVVAPPKTEPRSEPSPAAAPAQAAAPSPAVGEAVGETVPQSAAGPTTAEAIAAELAAAEALRPAPSMATFAPECLTPGGATPMRRRTGGANLGVFKEMAAGMMRN